MLGEKMGSMTGATTTRPVPVDGGSLPKFEVSVQGGGTLAGVEVQTMATYSAQMKSNGSMYGECPNAGVIMAQNGVATFRAAGAGGMTETGGSSFRGAVYFESSTPSLMKVNGKCMAYEWEVDAEGNAIWKLWLWA